MTPVRVLLADDHAPTREEVRYALERDGGFVVCAEAADAAAAIVAATSERPDLCILDIRMPGGGVAAAWEIRARLPDVPIVMFTVSEDDDDLFAALRAGASGYLLKDVHPRRLPHALERVLEGEVALPRALVGKLVEEFRDTASRRRKIIVGGQEGQLTSREWQILDLLRQELSTTEIADRLVLSPVTVRTHVSALLRKLQVRSREDLLRRFNES